MKIKIYCFEGEWHEKHRELSVKPLMQVLQQACYAFGPDLILTYHFCQTVERLKKDLEKLSRRGFSTKDAHRCFYFAFHGTSKGLVDLEGSLISFSQIAEAGGDRLNDSIVLFGSCGAKASKPALDDFKERTGAKLVVGYSASVSWIASSCFEMLFFNELRNRSYTAPLKKRIQDLVAPSQSLFSELKVIIV